MKSNIFHLLTSVTRLGNLAPIGRQIKLTGSFFNFRRAQLIGLQIGQFLKSPIFVTFCCFSSFHEQIHVNLSSQDCCSFRIKFQKFCNKIFKKSKFLPNNFKNLKILFLCFFRVVQISSFFTFFGVFTLGSKLGIFERY